MGVGYRTCILDIENFPNFGYAWEQQEKYPSRQNLISVERPWNIASFAYKWAGGPARPLCVALPDFPKTYRKDPFDDSELLKELHAILDEANLIVGHNVKQFDLRKIRARMFKHHQKPPSPFRVYDTLTEARSLGMFPSNRLGDLARFLDCPIGGKVEHEGFAMWLKCMNGDMDAWKRMKRYNIQDVAINEWVYHRLRPWSTNHPNVTILGGESFLCPVCGSRTKRAGWNEQKAYRTQRYYCLNRECGKFSSGPRERLTATLLT
jgi:hypothetical protein